MQIQKFYLHDATANLGIGAPTHTPWTAPSQATVTITGSAAGATTNRVMNEVIGTANPDVEVTITSNANTLAQDWALRRWVCPYPLEEQTLPFSSTPWNFSYAQTEANANHNGLIRCQVYTWRPSIATVAPSSTGNRDGIGTEPGTTQTPLNFNLGNSTGATAPVKRGDLLVVEIITDFTQSMATAYTDSFAYDGTTEASTTTCASFLNAPSAIEFYTPREAGVNFQDPAVLARAHALANDWRRRKRGILVPDLWLPNPRRPLPA